MPRVIVTTDPSPLSAYVSVWLDERVGSVHLSTRPRGGPVRRAAGLGDQRRRGRRRCPAGSPGQADPRPRGSRPATRGRCRTRVLGRPEEL